MIIVTIPQLIVILRSRVPSIKSTGIFMVVENRTNKAKRHGLRKGLIIFQFALSIILISGSIYIHKQNNYLFNQRMGKEMGPVVVLPELNWSAKEKNFEFKNRLLQSHLIKNVTSSMEPPSGYIMDAMGFEMEGFNETEEEKMIYVFPVDDNYLDFYQIPVIAGENFSTYDSDSKKEEYILNESAMHFLGYENPENILGREFKLHFFIDSIFQGGIIKAVVKDFNLSPLHEKIKPLVLFQKPIWYGTMMIEIDPANIEESLSFIRTTWDRIFPEYFFDYRFSNDMYRASYQNEKIQSDLSKYFSFLAIFLASLGMFAMSTFMARSRIKEITIRKVNGADSLDIFYMLTRQFMNWIITSVILAVPAGWWVIMKWSENYPYKVNLSWWIFLISGIMALVFAWLSVLFQTIQASRQNPVEALRYE
jgi:putative ABC transport system permease protein